MSKGKYQNKKHNRGTKTLVMLLALVLTLGCVIGGTVAWLTAQSDPVTNTFTVGDITIDLKEHKLDEDGKLTTGEANETNAVEYKAFVPGQTLPKDPFVTVEANSEKCWLFVEVIETNNTRTDLTGKIIDWTFEAEGQNGTTTGTWTQLTGKNVWYTIVDKNTSEQVWTVLKDDQVTVNSNITKTQAAAIANAKPTLTFNAYAVQYDYLKNGDAEVGNDAAKAWEMAKPSENSGN